VLAAVGLAVSVFLTAVHYQGVPLACITTGPLDCDAVTTSTFSFVPGTGVPVALAGVLWFAVSAVAAALAAFGPDSTRLRAAHFAWCVAGLVTVLYLVYAELAVIRRICEWCTAVHLLVLGSFALALLRLQEETPATGSAGRR